MVVMQSFHQWGGGKEGPSRSSWIELAKECELSENIWLSFWRGEEKFDLNLSGNPRTVAFRNWTILKEQRNQAVIFPLSSTFQVCIFLTSDSLPNTLDSSPQTHLTVVSDKLKQSWLTPDPMVTNTQHKIECPVNSRTLPKLSPAASHWASAPPPGTAKPPNLASNSSQTPRG